MTCMEADSVLLCRKTKSMGKGDAVLGGCAVSQELIMLGEHIRSRRTELCLSQEVLAEKVGISANTVSRIEGGQMSMTIGIFIKLVRALDTDADRLLGIVPAREADRKYRDILYQISHLKTYEQKVVLRIVEVLADEFHRNK